MIRLKTSVAYSIITGLIASLVFVYTTFATISYVDIKHASVKEDLADIKDMLFIINDRIYKLNKGDE